MPQDEKGHTLTAKQVQQKAEVEAAQAKAGNAPTEGNTDLGGSDANSGPGKPAAPVSAQTPTGSGTTTGTSGTATART